MHTQAWGTLLKNMEAKPRNEQLIMQGLMKGGKASRLSFRFLPSSQFKNGIPFGGTAGRFQKPASKYPRDGLVFVHCNWIIGIANKIQMLRYHGWWYI